MKKFRIVIDTNVMVSALNSRKGASYQLFRRLGSDAFDFYLSVPLFLEYEAIILRKFKNILTEEKITDALDYIAQVSRHQKIYYLWRPQLKDFKDEMALDLAVASQADFIVTFNVKNFNNLASFGIRTISPGQFLRKIGALA